MRPLNVESNDYETSGNCYLIGEDGNNDEAGGDDHTFGEDGNNDGANGRMAKATAAVIVFARRWLCRAYRDTIDFSDTSENGARLKDVELETIRWFETAVLRGWRGCISFTLLPGQFV